MNGPLCNFALSSPSKERPLISLLFQSIDHKVSLKSRKRLEDKIFSCQYTWISQLSLREKSVEKEQGRLMIPMERQLELILEENEETLDFSSTG